MTSRHMTRASKKADGQIVVLAALPLTASIVGAIATLLVTHTPRLALLPLLLTIPLFCLLMESMGDMRTDWGKIFFPALLLTASICYAITFPPGTVPDEPSHARVAYVYANLVTPGYGPDTMRAEDAAFLHEELINHPEVTGERFRAIGNKRPLTCSDNTRITHEELITTDLWGSDPQGHGLDYLVGSSPFYEKIGCTLGIVLGRAFNLSAWATFYLGRLCNALYCCLLIVLAVRLTPVGKGAFMAVSLLPMTLHEIGSYSYDGAILGLCFLALALLLKAIHSDEPMDWREAVPLYASLFLLGPCKMVYSLAAALGLLIPSVRFDSRRDEILFKLGLIAMPVLGVFVMSWEKIATIVTGTSTSSSTETLAHRGPETGTFYTVGDVIRNPLRTLQIMRNTLALKGAGYLVGMLGCSLAWFQGDLINVGIAKLLVPLLLLSALPSERPGDETVASYGTEESGARLRPLPSIAGPILFVALIAAIMLGEMLIWTFNTETIIDGVQGRYFLPMLPLLLLPLSWLKPIPRIASQLALSVFCFVDVVYLVSVIATLL